MSVADFCGSYLQVNFPQNKKKAVPVLVSQAERLSAS
jgi:hypothetical protein